MATTTYTATIGLFNEVELSIEYSVSGDYRAATYNHPAEEPELEVESVKVGGEEIPDWMYHHLEGEISDACWEHAHRVMRQQKEQAEDSLADYWDAVRDRRRDDLAEALA